MALRGDNFRRSARLQLIMIWKQFCRIVDKVNNSETIIRKFCPNYGPWDRAATMMGSKMAVSKSPMTDVPEWVPVDVQNYVFHTEMGQPIRGLARAQACHASTIMRQIRRIETLRDDPLVDRAIQEIVSENETIEGTSDLDAIQALRRLVMPDTLLAVSLDMEQGVIVQAGESDGSDHATGLPFGTLLRLAIRGWIATQDPSGRVLRYRITPAGRTALRTLVAHQENTARAMAEAPAPFRGAAKSPTSAPRSAAPVLARPTHQDSPITALARRRDKDGTAFLTRAMVRAAERLREDFELAQVARYRTEKQVLAWIETLGITAVDVQSDCAETQLRAALVCLGPGLAEIAMRCCCFLEGLETTEKRMGWAARSGKVVLRIALQRLVLHYEDAGMLGPRIG